MKGQKQWLQIALVIVIGYLLFLELHAIGRELRIYHRTTSSDHYRR